MSRSSGTNSRGADLERRFRSGVQRAEGALRPGARDLAILRGVSQKCSFSRPQENVLAELGEQLVSSGRVYRYGNQIAIESNGTGSRSLTTLSTDRQIERAACGLLANLIVCETSSADSENKTQFPTPPRLIELCLNHEPTLDRLPIVTVYATRPLFDQNFHWRGPGWHPDVGYLIHGEDIEPIIPDYNTQQTESIPPVGNAPDIAEVRSRLPPRLRELLMDYPFRSASDLVNAVAALLTGLLVTHFIEPGKPIFVVDGNQPSLGKTLFARMLGLLFGVREPAPVKYTSDDTELEKKACATLRGGHSTVFLIDNAKTQGGAVESAVLETNSTAPIVVLRILGTSTNYERPNDLVWIITMNGTKLGPDLTERSCPIRLHYDGEANSRPITNLDPIGFVRRHRSELIGELAGMVMNWAGAGRQHGTQVHRLREWAQIIGGILDANRLFGFLGNLVEAKADFNSEFDQLAALAEDAIRQGGAAVHVVEVGAAANDTTDTNRGVLARELEPVFRRAGVLLERLGEAKSQSAKSTIIGAYLSPHIGRSFAIESDQRRGQATLRRVDGRSNSKRYHFEILWSPADDSAPPEPSTAPPDIEFAMAAEAPPSPAPCSAPTNPAEGGNDLAW